MTEKITRSDTGGLCTLTLNRPEKLNALDTDLFTQLDTHLATLETQTDSVGCVVLRGTGRGFCAGADLGAIDTTLGDYKPKIIDRLGRLPQPTIAAVHGVCYTGAVELILACDFIIADATARFADTHGKWGLVGNWGISQRLPRRIGYPAAKRLSLTARTIGADEAQAIGLVDELTGAGGLDALVESFTAEILANSWHTNLHTKQFMLATEGMSLAAGLQYERDHYPGFAPDYAERVANFGKK